MEKKSTTDNLGTRMKGYENVTRNYLVTGIPKVIRLDMRAGHTFCRKFKRPFDDVFSECMIFATKELCQQIPGVMIAYTQSDEISLIVNDVSKRGKTNCFFGGNISKIVSLSASICTLAFNQHFTDRVASMQPKDRDVYLNMVGKAQFDSRVFCLPNVQEVHNYLIWRQQDATRNSIQAVGHANFSQKEMHNKNTDEIQEMLFTEKDINWNDYPVKYKRGCAIVREKYIKAADIPGYGHVETERSRWTEVEIPILTKDLNFVPELYNYGFYRNGKIDHE